jgi:hypothetical protein
MQALSIIRKIAPHASISCGRKALSILNKNLKKIESIENSPEIESRRKFILKTKEIINENIITRGKNNIKTPSPAR